MILPKLCSSRADKGIEAVLFYLKTYFSTNAFGLCLMVNSKASTEVHHWPKILFHYYQPLPALYSTLTLDSSGTTTLDVSLTFCGLQSIKGHFGHLFVLINSRQDKCVC